jgi:hypothetical protein
MGAWIEASLEHILPAHQIKTSCIETFLFRTIISWLPSLPITIFIAGHDTRSAEPSDASLQLILYIHPYS